MAHATPDPRSFGSDDVHTIPSNSEAKQAATRAAYIAQVVSEAPPISDEVIDRIAVLLRPRAATVNGTAAISIADYHYWETRRYLQSQGPSQHGYYTAGDAA